MKLRKVLSAATALAMAASAAVITSVSSSAAFEAEQFVCLASDSADVPVLKDKALLDDICGFTATISVDRYRDFESAINAGDWIGGGLGMNASSTQWISLSEWSTQADAKPTLMAPTDTRGMYTITYLQDKPCFKADEAYAYFWLQDYSTDKSYNLKVEDVILLDKDGNDIMAGGSTTTPAEPDEPTAEPAEPTAEPDEPTAEPDEPTAEPEETAEPTVESDEPTAEPEETGEPVEAEADWDLYDAEAAAAANEAFKFGETDAIDLYSVLGDDIYDLAKVDATFTWTAGTGWCGGAGIANAISEDGSTWLSGPEFGCANANEALVNDGTATQTIVDITGNPLTTIATVDAEGNSTFATLLVQNWWNGVEAGAQLTKLSFTDADGNVLGELTWGEDATDAPSTPATTPSDSKGSPDTGVAGVAAAAGVAALAGVAVVVARKRK